MLITNMKEEFKVIANLIEDNTRVLDVGCGDGTLMEYLKKNKNIDPRGLELSKRKIQESLGKGLSVIEGNAETDLKQFPDKSFNYAILSQTLQAFYNPEKVLDELLRVANIAIITIPNFAHINVRLQLLIKGKMPVTKNLPDEWYNTPNLHMCSIKDFFEFCDKKNLNLFKALTIKNQKISEINKRNLFSKNLFSELGIFLIKKK